MVSGLAIQAYQEQQRNETVHCSLEQTRRERFSASMFHRATDIHRDTSLTKLFSQLFKANIVLMKPLRKLGESLNCVQEIILIFLFATLVVPVIVVVRPVKARREGPTTRTTAMAECLFVFANERDHDSLDDEFSRRELVWDISDSPRASTVYFVR